jgi:hypothetical protein
MTIEALIVGYLNDNMDVPAYGEVPAERPESFAVVTRVGGSEVNRLRTASIVVYIYGPSLAEVQVLNEDLLECMDGLAASDMVASCRLNSNYNDTDLSVKEYRYGALFDIVYY